MGLDDLLLPPHPLGKIWDDCYDIGLGYTSLFKRWVYIF